MKGQRFSKARATTISRPKRTTTNRIAYKRSAWVSGNTSSAATVPTKATIALDATNIARSRVTEEIRLSMGILGPRAETRRPSPNICPRAPTWPTASDASRSWSMRRNETPPLQPVRVSRQAQVFTTCATPPKAMIRASPHPSVEILSRRLPRSNSPDQIGQQRSAGNSRDDAKSLLPCRRRFRHC